MTTRFAVSADEGLPVLPLRPEWWDYANCLGVGGDRFFPERGESTREAKEVCQGCEVREECLDFAITNSEKHGIWGGLSERQRRRVRRQRQLLQQAAS